MFIRRCHLRCYDNPGTFLVSCVDAIKYKEELLSDFRKRNGTDKAYKAGIRDRTYEEFCGQLDDFINQCECWRMCPNCSKEDHEGYLNVFCRCEDRNIKVAKIMREKGISWREQTLE